MPDTTTVPINEWNAMKIANMPRYSNGIEETLPLALYMGKVTSNGSGRATFNLTKGGLSSDAAIFADVKQENIMCWINNKSQSISQEYFSVSADKKQLNIDLIRLAVVLGLLSYTTPGNSVEVVVWVIGPQA